MIYFNLVNNNPPTPKAPGNITPRGTATIVCKATSITELSGTTFTKAKAETADKAAPANKVTGDDFNTDPATGNSAGENSIAVPINGRTFSLDASKTPIKSFSSANLSKGAAEVKVKPDFSNFDSNPNWEVY